MKAIVTGSGGLIGSECSRLLCEQGWQVVGIDNDMRAQFFGSQGTTRPVVQELIDTRPGYRHQPLDIRDRQQIRDLFAAERPDFIIHTAAQPSHDKAASIPYDDFDVNAVATLNLLVAARDFCPESPFCFTSTNKVYGDRPNFLPLVELEKRYDYAGGLDGIDESMSIDACLHSIFGASKAAADLLCQEFGRYFNMPVGIFRGGCLTGPMHAAVELHGYLAYIVHCAVTGKPYTIYGYKGKQVRDQIHARDVASLFLHFYRNPRAARSTTWAAVGPTAFRCWRPLTRSPGWVSACGMSTATKTAAAITSATFPTFVNCTCIFPNGAWPMICRASCRKSWSATCNTRQCRPDETVAHHSWPTCAGSAGYSDPSMPSQATSPCMNPR